MLHSRLNNCLKCYNYFSRSFCVLKLNKANIQNTLLISISLIDILQSLNEILNFFVIGTSTSDRKNETSFRVVFV